MACGNKFNKELWDLLTTLSNKLYPYGIVYGGIVFSIYGYSTKDLDIIVNPHHVPIEHWDMLVALIEEVGADIVKFSPKKKELWLIPPSVADFNIAGFVVYQNKILLQKKAVPYLQDSTLEFIGAIDGKFAYISRTKRLDALKTKTGWPLGPQAQKLLTLEIKSGHWTWHGDNAEGPQIVAVKPDELTIPYGHGDFPAWIDKLERVLHRL